MNVASGLPQRALSGLWRCKPLARRVGMPDGVPAGIAEQMSRADGKPACRKPMTLATPTCSMGEMANRDRR
jgi:hypothetical protein